jgi:hypothetical protein
MKYLVANAAQYPRSRVLPSPLMNGRVVVHMQLVFGRSLSLLALGANQFLAAILTSICPPITLGILANRVLSL